MLKELLRCCSAIDRVVEVIWLSVSRNFPELASSFPARHCCYLVTSLQVHPTPLQLCSHVPASISPRPAHSAHQNDIIMASKLRTFAPRIHKARGPHTASMIMLHGFGSVANDFDGLADLGLDHFKFILPQA